jgi:FKBP-type peptidyl-prolyl cis-trans isomerase (trigger factor)
MLLLEAVAQRMGCQVEESEVEERIEQMARIRESIPRGCGKPTESGACSTPCARR